MAIYECKPELASISVLLEIQRKGGGKVRTLNFDSTTGEWVGRTYNPLTGFGRFAVPTKLTVEEAVPRMTDRQLRQWIILCN